MNRLKMKMGTDSGSIESTSIETAYFFKKHVSNLEEYISSSSSEIDENYINRSRLKSLKKQFTKSLTSLILNEDFEFGVENRVDILVKNQMAINSLATKEWLNTIFVENFNNIPIIVGILRTIARIDYYEIYPEGQTIAIASLSHKNTEVQECGVRAFENWGTLQSLGILENLKVSTHWIQEYIDEVVSDLRKEYNATVS